MPQATTGHVDPISRKIVSISQKRQITIPKKYFTLLGFESEAECFLRGNELVIRPIAAAYDSDFAAQILEDLISQGYEGSQLLSEFKMTQKKIRPAVNAMLRDASKVAEGKAEYFTASDVFDEEE